MESHKVPGLTYVRYWARNHAQPYRRDEERLGFFGSVADCIVSDIAPSTVLDVGCGAGLLVESLRQRGVEAFGMDASEHAIQDVHPDIRPYCRASPITGAFAQRYDLIVCVEVLGHLPRQEAERAVENLCQHSDDVLFSSRPPDYQEMDRADVQPLEYWAELFAHCGFFHDVDFDASFITPWAVRFRKAREPVARVIAAYERRLWEVERENQARRALNTEQHHELALKEQAVQALSAQVRVLSAQVKNWEKRWADLERTVGWALLQRLQHLRSRLSPPGSARDRWLESTFRTLRALKIRALIGSCRRIGQTVSWHGSVVLWKMGLRTNPPGQGQTIQLKEIQYRTPLQLHQSKAEIIVCVHNALPDVQRCLESVVRHTTPPYSLVLVDDGSDQQTRGYLSEFAQAQGATLLRNDTPQGYTRAANQGLKYATAEHIVLLNSDTAVTPRWLDRLVACADSDPHIGIVGPLSNTASWQSIPEIEHEGDWATNPLPEGTTVEEMGQLVAQTSARLYPTMPFLNGFCLLIRRQVLREVGYFDEDTFGPGYGEEDDYALRARKAGWLLALADDAYVYHAQSRSYSAESRKGLAAEASRLLAEKHGQQVIGEGIAFCRRGRVLEGIRARSRVMFARQKWIKRGRAKFAGSHVLFVLPIAEPGGGANVVVTEAMAMRAMGVDVGIFNVIGHRDSFERAYPGLELPVFYGEREHITTLASEYDAVVSTVNFSVEWLSQITRRDGRPVRGYYVQGFEPYIYSPGTEDFRRAWASYSLFPDLVRFTKTEWVCQQLEEQIGVHSTMVGVSFDVDLFRPRPRSGPEWPDRPLKVVAMVRPMTPYREPKLTMNLLRQVSYRYGTDVEIVIFGTLADDPGFVKLSHGFSWRLAGILHQKQVAALLNEVDIFVDFSSHQAMGLTALEAMACGVAVIVPERGGAVDFARHEENSLVVDTSSPKACWLALQRLIEDHDLRLRLQRNAVVDVVDFFPERSAFCLLNALFNPAESRTHEPSKNSHPV